MAGAVEALQTASCPWGAGGLDCEEESESQGMGTGCTSPEGLERHAAGAPGSGGRGGCCPGLKEGSWGPGQGTKTCQAQTDLTSGGWLRRCLWVGWGRGGREVAGRWQRVLDPC